MFLISKDLLLHIKKRGWSLKLRTKRVRVFHTQVFTTEYFIICYKKKEKCSSCSYLPMTVKISQLLNRDIKGLRSKTFDPFFPKTIGFVLKSILQMFKGIYDSAPICISCFYDEYQSQGHILFKKLDGIPHCSQEDLVQLFQLFEEKSIVLC